MAVVPCDRSIPCVLYTYLCMPRVHTDPSILHAHDVQLLFTVLAIDLISGDVAMGRQRRQCRRICFGCSGQKQRRSRLVSSFWFQEGKAGTLSCSQLETCLRLYRCLGYGRPFKGRGLVFYSRFICTGLCIHCSSIDLLLVLGTSRMTQAAQRIYVYIYILKRRLFGLPFQHRCG